MRFMLGRYHGRTRLLLSTLCCVAQPRSGRVEDLPLDDFLTKFSTSTVRVGTGLLNLVILNLVA
eukprot:SAG31_NODE_1328_length_8747_cov_11.561474_6_plen_64_part_00